MERIQEDEDVYNQLLQASDIIPDEYDGSYELVREGVKAFSTVPISKLDVTDLDALWYLCAGADETSVQHRQSLLEKSHLQKTELSRMVGLLDEIWKKAVGGMYSKRQTGDNGAVGMFSTATATFNRKIVEHQRAAQEFIPMVIAISRESDEEKILSIAEQYLKTGWKGLKTGTISPFLHCLKPDTFPIINGKQGMGTTVYASLGITLTQPNEASTYVANVRKIRDFRNTHFSFKNYRVMDLVEISPKVTQTFDISPNDWFPAPEIYSPEISTEKWIELLKNPDIFSENALQILKRLRDYGGEATCTELSNTYGESANYYNSGSSRLAKRIWKATNCPLLPNDKNENSRWWPILYKGKYAEKERKGTYVWKLRPELAAALEYLFPVEPNQFKQNSPQNMILYGPPGTGKTYSTVLHAISILEGKDVTAEPYDSLLGRYNQYKKEGRIASVTFHQSYGYEDFVEGIKPVISTGETPSLAYIIEDGTFKTFCSRARTVNVLEIPPHLLNSSPTIWKVSLYGAGENAVKTDCFENNRIRISVYESDDNGKTILNAFMNKMRIGDVVLSLYSNKEIDGIGIITGPAEDLDDVETYRRSRPVHWVATNIRVNILTYNDNKVLTTGTVYRLPSMTLETVKEIVTQLRTVSSKPHVFIIDEINRGNISKIFGELITLIEPTKRLGEREGTTVQLPYSKQEFGVPSNIYLLGTMNTADRSLALLDTALRRRFTFVEMLPEPDQLRDIIIEGINLANILKKMNERIEILYDREHTLGHAYFMPLKDSPTLEHLAEIFSTKIIPLLQEYFYCDYEKIRLVLGDNQVDNTDSTAFIHRIRADSQTLFGKFVEDIAEYRYVINKPAFRLPAAYQKIVSSEEK
ncbi:MAG TPA: AAA family ATPase [Methanocorpusculum sp.]|nr:AAA family ATPase [Methanocorpusculum sp.]HJK80476.1 AAA family ATPase [Methanocorpusculum sp.]